MTWGHGEGFVKSYTYKELDELMGDRDRLCLKRTRAQVWAERNEDLIKIRLHETYIVIYYPDDVIELDSGGWRTQLTKNRMNDLLPRPWRIASKNGVWYVGRNGWNVTEAAVFDDGILLYPDGETVGEGNEKEIRVLRKRVSQYAKKFAAAFMAGDVPEPSGGDCWMCCGMSPGNTDHLHSHMEENYFVPRLLYEAIEDIGIGSLYKGMIGNMWRDGETGLPVYNEYLQQEIEKVVRKYMQHNLGLWVK